MQTVSQLTREIVDREGGFVNDPDDPGGATNYGVTIHTMRRLGMDITGDGKISVADVRSLTRAQAEDIMTQFYFHAPRIGDLPDALHANVFDMYVNAGSNAVRILQCLLRDMGLNVTIDGIIGPQTINAARKAYEMAPNHLNDAYAIARRNYYFRLADYRVASRKYARTKAGGKGGWIRRAEEFMAPRFRMSAAQFKERTSSWG